MSTLQNQALRPISRERARKTTHFGVVLNFRNRLGVELWPTSIFTGGKRAAALPEIQNSIKLKDLGLETYLTRKSAKNYAEWSNSELLERSRCRVMPKFIVFLIFNEKSNSGCNCRWFLGCYDFLTVTAQRWRCKIQFHRFRSKPFRIFFKFARHCHCRRKLGHKLML